MGGRKGGDASKGGNQILPNLKTQLGYQAGTKWGSVDTWLEAIKSRQEGRKGPLSGGVGR